MRHSREVAFAPDHPTAAGHFPGNPIIPGAVLLDHVMRALDLAGGSFVIRTAKFLEPVRPGQSIRIRWQTDAPATVRFECVLLDPERPAVVGTMQKLASEP
jgi:3-hydroxymyristoyl/3-hydroxydecanoyl-(acyl carrier protein) dehydratase